MVTTPSLGHPTTDTERGMLLPGDSANCLFMSAKTEVKEGAPRGEHAAPLHGVVFAHPRVALDALAVLAWEAVAWQRTCSVRAGGTGRCGHSDVLSFKLSEFVRTFWSFYTSD